MIKKIWFICAAAAVTASCQKETGSARSAEASQTLAIESLNPLTAQTSEIDVSLMIMQKIALPAVDTAVTASLYWLDDEGSLGSEIAADTIEMPANQLQQSPWGFKLGFNAETAEAYNSFVLLGAVLQAGQPLYTGRIDITKEQLNQKIIVRLNPAQNN